jgi:hypothetical protein
MYLYEVLISPTGTSPCDKCPGSCPWIQGDPVVATIQSNFAPLGKDDIFPPKPVGRQKARAVAKRAYRRVDGLIEKFGQLTKLTMTRNDALHMATGEEFRLKCEQITDHSGCVFSATPMSITQMPLPNL